MEPVNAKHLELEGAVKRAKSYIESLINKGAADIFVGSFLTKVATFLGSIIIVRVLSVEDYGQLSFAENKFTYIYLVAGLGLNNAVFRYIVLADSSEKKRGVFNHVLVRGTAFNFVLVFVAILICRVVPSPRGFEKGMGVLPILLIALPVHYVFDTCTYSLRALFKNRSYVISAFAAIILVWSTKVIGAKANGVYGAAWATPIAYLIMMLALIAYFQFYIFQNVESTKVGKDLSREMLGFSIQYMVTNGLWVLFAQNDLLILGQILGDAAILANYRVAYVIPSALSILSSSIGTFVVPYFVKNEDNKNWVWDNYKRVVAVTFGMVVGASIMVICFGRTVVSFAYGEQYLGSLPVMGMLLISSLANNGLRYPTANLLAAMGNIRVNMIVSACGMVLQVILDFILIPYCGIYGAALCSIIVYSLMAASVIVAFIKINHPALSTMH